MLAALTNRSPVTGDALPRATRVHAVAGHERHLFGELSPPWWSAPFGINILLFTTEIKQFIPFLATLQLFCRTENYLLCKGRGLATAGEPVFALVRRLVSRPARASSKGRCQAGALRR